MDKQPPRSTLLLYTEWREPFSQMRPEELSQLILGLMQYQIDGTLPVLPAAATLVCSFVLPAIQRNNAKYDDKIAKKRMAGSLGGKARARNAKAKAANKTDNGTEADTSDATSAQAHASNATIVQAHEDVRVCVPVPVPVPDPVPAPTHPTDKGGRDREAEFEILANEYPRKEAIAAARRAYDNVEAPLDVLLGAIHDQEQSDQWRREGGRFIPQLARWLVEERWEDQCQRTSPGYIRHGDPPTPGMIASIQDMLKEPDYSEEVE